MNEVLKIYVKKADFKSVSDGAYITKHSLEAGVTGDGYATIPNSGTNKIQIIKRTNFRITIASDSLKLCPIGVAFARAGDYDDQGTNNFEVTQCFGDSISIEAKCHDMSDSSKKAVWKMLIFVANWTDKSKSIDTKHVGIIDPDIENDSTQLKK